uniref:Chromo domain-containing protein n=1 Tax=Eptatretus burgeri TaxID=7764 RepID=A0A8C4QMA3_EPTBU
MAGGRRGPARQQYGRPPLSPTSSSGAGSRTGLPGPASSPPLASGVGPLHIRHPKVPELAPNGGLAFEGFLFLYLFLALLTHLLNLYKTVWWYPAQHPPSHTTLNFHLIDYHLVAFITALLARRLIWALVCQMGEISPGTVPQLVLLLSLRVALLTVSASIQAWTLSRLFHSHSLISLLFLCYPCLVYVPLYWWSRELRTPRQDTSSNPTDKNGVAEEQTERVGMSASRFLFLLLEALRQQFVGASVLPPHACALSPPAVRAEVQLLKWDFNLRIKEVLYNSLLSAYYVAFLPLCFLKSTQHYDMRWSCEHLLLVWVNSFVLLTAHRLPPTYCDRLHRAAAHLGCWQRLEPGAHGNTPQHTWSESIIWPQGVLVRHQKSLYRALGTLNVAIPSDVSHARFYEERLYRVRWKGYQPNEDTWEPIENLAGCEELLYRFHKRHPLKSSELPFSTPQTVPLEGDENIKSSVSEQDAVRRSQTWEEYQERKRKKKERKEKRNKKEKREKKEKLREEIKRQRRDKHHKHDGEKKSKKKRSESKGQGISGEESIQEVNHKANQVHGEKSSVAGDATVLKQWNDEEEACSAGEESKSVRNESEGAEMSWEGSGEKIKGVETSGLTDGSIEKQSRDVKRNSEREDLCKMKEKLANFMEIQQEIGSNRNEVARKGSESNQEKRSAGSVRENIKNVGEKARSDADKTKRSGKRSESIKDLEIDSQEAEKVGCEFGKAELQSKSAVSSPLSAHLSTLSTVDRSELSVTSSEDHLISSPDEWGAVSFSGDQENEPIMNTKSDWGSRKHKSQVEGMKERSKSCRTDRQRDNSKLQMAASSTESQSKESRSDKTEAVFGKKRQHTSSKKNRKSKTTWALDSSGQNKRSEAKNQTPESFKGPGNSISEMGQGKSSWHDSAVSPTSVAEGRIGAGGEAKRRKCSSVDALSELDFTWLDESKIRSLMHKRSDSPGNSIPTCPSDLREAVKAGDLRTTQRMLLDFQASINLQEQVWDGPGLLFLAASAGRNEILQLLLRRGANPNPSTPGVATALQIASAQGFLSTVELLLSNGAHIHAQQSNGDTALSKACRAGHLIVIRLLLDNGAYWTEARLCLRPGLSMPPAVQDVLKQHSDGVMRAMEAAIRDHFEPDLKIMDVAFPPACHRLCEGSTFTMEFESSSPFLALPGAGIVLFAAHWARTAAGPSRIRLSGESSVLAVSLNGNFQLPLFMVRIFVCAYHVALHT